MSTVNNSGKTIWFHTTNSGINFAIENGVTANIGDSDDKQDDIIYVKFGKDDKDSYSLTTESKWPKDVLSAKLTLEDGFLTIRSTNLKEVRKAVFNKKN